MKTVHSSIARILAAGFFALLALLMPMARTLPASESDLAMARPAKVMSIWPDRKSVV